jgi:dipeptidase E
MKTIVAISGGGIAPNVLINKRIVELSKKSEPNTLFLPTADGDTIAYFDEFKDHFSQLGCKCDALYLIRDKPTKEIIAEKMMNSDIIYVGGGNTFRMLQIWKKMGVDLLLREAYEQGKVLCGGAICWFKYGNTDSRKNYNPEADLFKVTGLNWINALMCPHYDFDPERKPSLKKMMKKNQNLVALALDNCCAIEILEDQYRIISAQENAHAYKVYWQRGIFFEERIEQTETYQLLSDLLAK